MKPKIQSEEVWSKAPKLFAVFMSINVASYAVVLPLMSKTLEIQDAGETSVISVLSMLVLTVVGMLLAGKLSEKAGKGISYTLGAIISAFGVIMCALDAFDKLAVPGPTVTATATGDSLFFIVTYIVSDVFSEVFGYKASRLSGNTAAIFAFVVALVAKLMSVIPSDEAGEAAFNYIYGGGLYATTVGIAIYAVGDFLDDKLFAYIKKKKSGDQFSSYSVRSIGSSLLGKTADIALFTTLVLVPFSNATFCEKFKIENWGWTSKQLLGNFLFGIAIQITIEALMSPVSYKISTKVKKQLEAD